MSYTEDHQNSGFVVGDKVVVKRKAGDFENGWKNSWVDSMDIFIDKTSTITSDGGRFGFVLELYNENVLHYDFPWFVLEKVGQ